MVIKNKAIILALCLLCWTSTPHYDAVKSDNAILYAIFKDRFNEPIEVMYFLMNDMKLFKTTSNDENKIAIVLWTIKGSFKQEGYEVSDVIVIIHNHVIYTHFSPDDIVVYNVFKGEGFEGKFYIYVRRNKTIYELAERLR